jgi:hypothetical protein
MPDRRGRNGSLEGLLPDDRQAWARGIWKDRDEVAKLPSGAWLLREAAKVLGISEEVVDQLLRERR